MVLDTRSYWPEYSSFNEALTEETRSWGARLDVAMHRYDNLDGELPSTLGKLVISRVDGEERPENFSMLETYQKWGADPASFGALMLVNYIGKSPPSHTLQLIETIREQREVSGVPTAISVVGYLERRIDQMTNDVWDIAVGHALQHSVPHKIIGISNDADMNKTSLDYFPNMTTNQYVDRPGTVWGTEVFYDQPGGPDLPLNRLVQYLNTGRKLWEAHNRAPMMYGASMALALDTHATVGWLGGHNRYGAGEPTRLVQNIRARMTLENPEDYISALRRHAKHVEGWVEVSSRRELIQFASLLNEGVTKDPFTTGTESSSYRRLSYDELAGLAASVSSVELPACKALLDKIDASLMGVVPKSHLEGMQQDLLEARKRFELPAPNH